MTIRCEWTSDDPLMTQYHDEEWGVPKHDDRRLFEGRRNHKRVMRTHCQQAEKPGAIPFAKRLDCSSRSSAMPRRAA